MNQSRKGLLCAKLIDHSVRVCLGRKLLSLSLSLSLSLWQDFMPRGGCCWSSTISKKETPAFIAQIHLKSTFVSPLSKRMSGRLFMIEYEKACNSISNEANVSASCVCVYLRWKNSKGEKIRPKKRFLLALL